MDLESTLESIASLKRIERKTLRMMIWDLKDHLQDKEVSSYQWLPKHEMWVDVLTKEMKMPAGLESMLLDNVLDLPGNKLNLIRVVNREIQMENIRNRKISHPHDERYERNCLHYACEKET